MSFIDNSISPLKEKLKKLKNKELKLEADLAIREYPEVEDAICRIALALNDYDKSAKTLKVMKASKSDKEKIEAFKLQIKYHEEKIRNLEACVSGLLGGDGEKYKKLLAKKEKAKKEVLDAMTETGPIFESNSVKILELIPRLREIL